MDALPFAKPARKARLPLPNPENRARMIDGLVNVAAAIEKEPEFVGFAIIGLRSDGARLSDWHVIDGGVTQLARVVRKEAAEIAKTFSREG